MSLNKILRIKANGKMDKSFCKTLLLGMLFISSACLSDAVRAKRTSFSHDDETSVIHTAYVGNNRTILAMFNLTDEQMGRIMAGQKKANGKDQSAETRDSQMFNIIKQQRLNDIRTRIQSAFNASNSEESQEHPQHEVAAYPICNAESNAASWLHDNNVTIQFANSIFEMKRENLNLDSAILRLYKMNPNGSSTEQQQKQEQQQHNQQLQQELLADDEPAAQGKLKRCTEPLLDSQIRVTVSIVQQMRRNNNKQRKKRICNTIMMNVSKTGWVEIDIKRAIYIWENVMREQQQQQQQQQQHHLQTQQTRQPILAGWLLIEVHDEEERPLKPGLFFMPPKCEQADVAIPWNYYGPQASVSSVEAEQVPRSPRIDVRLIGYASFAPKNYDKNLNKKLHENIVRQLHNLAKDENIDIENESTTSNSRSVDNLLESFESNEMLPHRHRKRHQQQQQQQLSNVNVATDNNESQQHAHRQHRRQRRHHNHNHNHHHNHHHLHHQQRQQFEELQQ